MKLSAYKDRLVAGWAGSVEMAWAGGQGPSLAADGSQAHSDVGATHRFLRLADPCPSEKQAARQLRLPLGSGSGQLPGWLQGKTVGVGRAGWESGGEEFMESFLKQLSPQLGFVG